MSEDSISKEGWISNRAENIGKATAKVLLPGPLDLRPDTVRNLQKNIKYVGARVAVESAGLTTAALGAVAGDEGSVLLGLAVLGADKFAGILTERHRVLREAKKAKKAGKEGPRTDIEGENVVVRMAGHLPRVIADTFLPTYMGAGKTPETKIGGSILAFTGAAELGAAGMAASTGQPEYGLAYLGLRQVSHLVQKLEEDLPKAKRRIQELRDRRAAANPQAQPVVNSAPIEDKAPPLAPHEAAILIKDDLDAQDRKARIQYEKELDLQLQQQADQEWRLQQAEQATMQKLERHERMNQRIENVAQKIDRGINVTREATLAAGRVVQGSTAEFRQRRADDRLAAEQQRLAEENQAQVLPDLDAIRQEEAERAYQQKVAPGSPSSLSDNINATGLPASMTPDFVKLDEMEAHEEAQRKQRAEALEEVSRSQQNQIPPLPYLAPAQDKQSEGFFGKIRSWFNNSRLGPLQEQPTREYVGESGPEDVVSLDANEDFVAIDRSVPESNIESPSTASIPFTPGLFETSNGTANGVVKDVLPSETVVSAQAPEANSNNGQNGHSSNGEAVVSVAEPVRALFDPSKLSPARETPRPGRNSITLVDERTDLSSFYKNANANGLNGVVQESSNATISDSFANGIRPELGTLNSKPDNERNIVLSASSLEDMEDRAIKLGWNKEDIHYAGRYLESRLNTVNGTGGGSQNG